MVSRRTYHSVRAAGLSPAEGVSAAALKTLLTIPTVGIIVPLFSATDITRGRCFLKPRAITLLYGWQQSFIAGHLCAQPDENAARATPGLPRLRQSVTRPVAAAQRSPRAAWAVNPPTLAGSRTRSFHLILSPAHEPGPRVAGTRKGGFAVRLNTAPRRWV